jgi:hypothetical protein
VLTQGAHRYKHWTQQSHYQRATPSITSGLLKNLAQIFAFSQLLAKVEL